MITLDRVKELLDYRPLTGEFTWKQKSSPMSPVKIGQVAGGVTPKGYLRIEISEKAYQAHRLAWLYMTGAWPRLQIDHINLDKSDNRWCNLREATNGDNKANTPLYRNNKCGLKGVHEKKPGSGIWRASKRTNGKLEYLGDFDCPAAAHFAYVIAADKAHGKFARSK